MLGLKINGEFLDLAPKTAVQLERVSPFTGSDSLSQERTFPVTLPYTPKNARLLGLLNHFYTRRKKLRVPAEAYDKNNFAYAGDLVIDAAKLNINDVRKSEISGFFVTGVSSFFQLVKGKKVKELQLGGIRSFAWTNADPASPAKGFWQHIHDTWSGNGEYTFDPIRNAKWAGNSEPGTPDWMNKLGADGNLDYNSNYNTLAPQVSLKYVLQCIFEEHGWRFDHSGMPDATWESLYMPSFYGVTWQRMLKRETPPFVDFAPLPTIHINLQNHVPPELTITGLIIALRNRYNWGFEFNSAKKVCTMAPLKNLRNGRKKDWTAYMAPEWESNFAEDEKIFSFKVETDGADGLSENPDLKNVQRGTDAFDFLSLPLPAENIFRNVIYCWKENQYYICDYSEEEQKYFWRLYADGVFDFEPDGANETFTTGCSTMPVYRTLYREAIMNNYYGYFPICEQEGNWEGKKGEFVPWTLRLLFHRGMVYEVAENGAPGPRKYPYLTSLATTPTQTEPDLPWSNVFKHHLKTPFVDVDHGIIEYWWKETLRYRQNSEVSKGKLLLPRLELVNFSWSDVILLRNIPYCIEKITEVIPYNQTVEVEARRIG